MSIEIDVKSVHSASSKTSLNHVPCEVQHNSEANVDKYFDTAIRPFTGSSNDENTELFSSSIRGRPLVGTKVAVPEAYSCVVLKELSKPFNEDDDRCFRAVHKVTEYTHWNLDLEPSSNDKYQQAKQWINISKVLHSPVDDTDSQMSTVSR